MAESDFSEYTLSAEELALAFSLVNRPDLGKGVLFETFGEMAPQALEERLKAAGHSLLARNLAYLAVSGIASISDDLQFALTPLLLYEGLIQMVLNWGEPQIINIHLGKKARFTGHWIEQGVVHRLVTGSLSHLADWISRAVSLPEHLPDEVTQRMDGKSLLLSMETLANLPEMQQIEGLEVLRIAGLYPDLAEALLADAQQPESRGTISYVPMSSDMDQINDFTQPVAGLLFLKGKLSWLLTFPRQTVQEGVLRCGTDAVLRASVRELLEKREHAFA